MLGLTSDASLPSQHRLHPPSSRAATLPLSKWIALTLNMSARTESRQVQAAIESRLKPRGKDKFCPQEGKRLLVFVDDLNMPAHDLYHSQPPLELLRQWLTYGTWYNRRECTLMTITDMQLLAAMGPPGGGRAEISARLLNRFRVIAMPFPPEREVKRIYRALIEDKLAEFEEEIRLLTDTFTGATIDVFKKARILCANARVFAQHRQQHASRTHPAMHTRMQFGIFAAVHSSSFHVTGRGRGVAAQSASTSPTPPLDGAAPPLC